MLGVILYSPAETGGGRNGSVFLCIFVLLCRRKFYCEIVNAIRNIFITENLRSDYSVVMIWGEREFPLASQKRGDIRKSKSNESFEDVHAMTDLPGLHAF